ncbi:MAG: hypothetical protein LBQ43_00280 [Holosporales bacterium]|nr:hypothetical protein [Holosporales bacterium]
MCAYPGVPNERSFGGLYPGVSNERSFGGLYPGIPNERSFGGGDTDADELGAAETTCFAFATTVAEESLVEAESSCVHLVVNELSPKCKLIVGNFNVFFIRINGNTCHLKFFYPVKSLALLENKIKPMYFFRNLTEVKISACETLFACPI